MDDMNTNASGSSRLEERGRERGGGEGRGEEWRVRGWVRACTYSANRTVCTRTHASFLFLLLRVVRTKQCACLHGHKGTLYTLHRQLLRENVIFDRKD